MNLRALWSLKRKKKARTVPFFETFEFKGSFVSLYLAYDITNLNLSDEVNWSVLKIWDQNSMAVNTDLICSLTGNMLHKTNLFTFLFHPPCNIPLVLKYIEKAYKASTIEIRSILTSTELTWLIYYHSRW